MGRVDIQGPCQHGRLARDDAYRMTVETAKAADDVSCPMLMELEDLPVVNECIDQLHDVVGDPFRGRQQGFQFRTKALGVVGRSEGRWALQVVVRKETQDVPGKCQS